MHPVRPEVLDGPFAKSASSLWRLVLFMKHTGKVVVAGVAAAALLAVEFADHGRPHAVFAVPAIHSMNVAVSNVSAQAITLSSGGPTIGAPTIRFVELKG